MKKKIFVCDDDDMALLLVEKTLQEEYNILCCKNPCDALGMILGFKPDLLLLDVMMPELNGFQLAKEVTPFIGESIPIIFLSANIHTDQIKEAYNAGGFDYIIKSGDPYEIKYKVREALEAANQKDLSCRKKLNELSSMVNRFLKTVINY